MNNHGCFVCSLTTLTLLSFYVCHSIRTTSLGSKDLYRKNCKIVFKRTHTNHILVSKLMKQSSGLYLTTLGIYYQHWDHEVLTTWVLGQNMAIHSSFFFLFGKNNQLILLPFFHVTVCNGMVIGFLV